MSNETLPCTVKSESTLSSNAYDGIVLVSSSPPSSDRHEEPLRSSLKRAAKLDNSFESDGGVLEVPLPAGRLIYAPTGPVNRDYDDVRNFGDAAKKGIQRALKAGVVAPLLVVTSHPQYPQAELVTLLGALEALYVPLQLREDVPSKKRKVEVLGVWCSDDAVLERIIPLALALESGRFVARDIGGGDPERMTPIKVEEYVRKLFGNSNIEMEVISDQFLLERDYPLYSAVNRAASVIERHKGRIIYLTYGAAAPVDKTLFLVGKGVTYDTGGADIKAGGVMAGMSRDKCGAAAVAGFMQVLNKLKPKGIKVVGALSMVRNSVGENSYVADEVITARSKARVRVGNTDAEGRMIMADVLCKMKELASDAVNPQLMTIATLTGHAALTVGPGYSIIMDNGPAKAVKNAQNIQESGEHLGDMFEISTLRREDYKFHKGQSEGDDIHQCNNLPSSRTPRGHQGPGAFLVLASGLDKHGIDSTKPIPYSHLDIAASGGDLPAEPTGAPILGLASHFILGRAG
ncbi:putative aminopeptidase W07G4.4 [Anabrus simplex]|uniref:putative aminopeptidase W07G4.4 n=1 Tax=Anabrus simplex TaxID=316456 RepID=UPI0035A29499